MLKRYYLPKSITIIDGTLREGLENEELLVKTDTKLFILNKLIDAGFQCMEAGAFASPTAMPQFRDTEEILKRVVRKPNLVYKCNAFNMKLVERAVKAKKEGYGADLINTQYALVEKLSQSMFGVGVSDRWKYIEDAVKALHDVNVKIQVSVLDTWDCPDINLALEATNNLLNIGCDIVRACDGLGYVTPPQAFEYFSQALDKNPKPDSHAFHYHDIRGFGLASYIAAMQAGCGRFDACLGGVGGPPATIVDGVPSTAAAEYHAYYPDRTGLVSTEDLVVMCDAMGIETGIDTDKVLVLGKWVEAILKRKLWSFCARYGKVPKYEPPAGGCF
ncbi:MAG: hydroxymethylglutaryl-CoA lyase [Dehalococcoidia bacterium]